MHARMALGVGKGVLFREVSSVQECPHKTCKSGKCTLGVGKVSSVQECPHREWLNILSLSLSLHIFHPPTPPLKVPVQQR